MKKHKIIRRVSALTMAAVISTANVAWVYQPPVFVSRAESSEDEIAQPEGIRAAETEYPKELGYTVEKQEDKSVLKFSNADILKKYFDVKLYAENSENVEIEDEGTVLSAENGYTLSITPKTYEGNENEISNPYNTSDDIENIESIPINVDGDSRNFAKLKTKELNDRAAFEVIRYEGAEDSPIYYGETVIIKPYEGKKANIVKGENVIAGITSEEAFVIDDTDIVSARTKLDFDENLLQLNKEEGNNKNYEPDQKTVLVGDEVVLDVIPSPLKKTTVVVNDSETFVNQQVKFIASDENKITATCEEVKFLNEAALKNDDISFTSTVENDKLKIKYHKRKCTTIDTVEVVSNGTTLSSLEGANAVIVDDFNGEFLIDGSNIHDDFYITVDYEINMVFDLWAYFDGMIEEQENDVSNLIKKIDINGETLNPNDAASFENLLDAENTVTFWVDNKYTVDIIEYVKDLPNEYLLYEKPSDDSENNKNQLPPITVKSNGDQNETGYSIQVKNDMRCFNSFTITLKNSLFSVDVTADATQCELIPQTKGVDTLDEKNTKCEFTVDAGHSNCVFTVKPKVGYYVSDIIYKQKNADGSEGKVMHLIKKAQDEMLPISFSYTIETNEDSVTDDSVTDDSVTDDSVTDDSVTDDSVTDGSVTDGSVKFDLSDFSSSAEIEVVLEEAKEITAAELSELYALQPEVTVGDNAGFVLENDAKENRMLDSNVNALFGVYGNEYNVKMKEVIPDETKETTDETAENKVHEYYGISCDPDNKSGYKFQNSEGQGFNGDDIKSKQHDFYIFDKMDNTIKKVIVNVERVEPSVKVTSIDVASETAPLRFLTFGIFGRDKINVTVHAECDLSVGGNDKQSDYTYGLTDIVLKDVKGETEIELNDVKGEVKDNKCTWTFEVDQKTNKELIYKFSASAKMQINGHEIDSAEYYIKVDSEGKIDSDGTDKKTPYTNTFPVSENKNDIQTIVEKGDTSYAPNVDINAFFCEENSVVYPKLDPEKAENNNYKVFHRSIEEQSDASDKADLNKSVNMSELSGGKLWTNSDFSYRIYANDEVSGVNNISYQLLSNESKYEENQFTLQSEDDKADNYVADLESSKHVAYDIPVKGEENNITNYTLNANAEDNCGNKTYSNETDKPAASMTVGIDKQKPVINSITAEVVDENGNRISDYTSGDWTNKPVKITVKVSDGAGSGINDVLLSVNDENIVNKESNSGKGEFTYIVSPNFNEEIKFTAVDNVGNNSEESAFTVRTENVAPGIVSFSVESVDRNEKGRGTDDNAGTALNDADNGIIETDYGFFFQNDVYVSVKADESYAEDKFNSGIGRIKFEKVSNTGESREVEPSIVDYENGEAVFIVEGGFKGQIVATPTDIAGNTGSAQNPDSLITETEERHRENSSLIITLPDSNGVKDAAGLPLYSENTIISLKATDNHSGIRNIKYAVRSVETNKIYYGSEQNNDVNFDNIDSISNDSVINDWSITKERNIVTHAEKNITVDKDENELEIWVWFEDNAGFTSGPVTERISIDKTAPEIISCELTGTAKNEKYFNTDRVATVKIKERNLNKAKTEELINVKLDEVLGAAGNGYSISSWKDEALSNLEGEENNLHTIEVTFNADAKYKFQMEAEDLTGRKAKVEGPEFIIDKTAPRITLGFDNNSVSNERYYNNNRTATITINEHNFDSSKGQTFKFTAYAEDNVTVVGEEAFIADGLKWTKSTDDPDVWSTQIVFDKDGRYNFSLSYEDLAGNIDSGVSADFFVDKTAPVIEQTFTPGNKERYATNGSYIPNVRFSDYNLFENGLNCEVKIKKIDMNGDSNTNYSPTSSVYYRAEVKKQAAYENVFDVFSDVEDKDGIYEITVSAEDKAGNKVENNHYTVSINRYGSTYAIVSDDAKNAVEKFNDNIPVNTEFDVAIQEVNVTELEGDSKITVIRDNSESNVLADGAYTVKSARTGKDDNGWYEINYTINKEAFENDGTYLINIESNDSAGNKNSNNTPVYGKRKCSVVFAIDRTLPEVIISGVEKDAKLKEAEADLTITCSDRNLRKANELSADDLKVMINDMSYDVEDLRKIGAEISNDASDNIIISLPVKTNKKNAMNDISVEIKDKAGNTSLADKSSIRFELAASFFARHLVLSLVLIALGVITLGSGGMIILKKVKNG